MPTSYKIVRLSDLDDIYDEYETPQAAKDDLICLCQDAPECDYIILKDDVKLTSIQLEAEIKSCELKTEIDDAFIRASKLPANFKPGGRRAIDDLAEGPNGEPTTVWKPPNPEDNYK
jgi:hypothetical protein